MCKIIKHHIIRMLNLRLNTSEWLTKHIHNLFCIIFKWTMHKYDSHEYSLYFTELEWNRSNTTFLSSGTFSKRNYLLGYIISNSLKNNVQTMCFHILKTIFSMGLHAMVFKEVFLGSDKFSMVINFIPEPINF